MQSFDVVLELQGVLFLLMLAGVTLRKLNIVDVKGRAYLTDILIDIILPCNIISAFTAEFNGTAMLAVFAVALAIQILSWLTGKFAYSFCEPRRRKVMQYATMCSNAGFMGNPIVDVLFGTEGLLYASVYLIPLRFFMWTAGISCFTDMRFKSSVKKLMLHPCIVAVWIGFVLMGSGVQPPGVLMRAIRYLSGCTMPVSIIIVGSVLAEADPRGLLDKQVVWFCFIRLILLPLIVLAVCAALRFDVAVTGVCVVLTCMPAGGTTAILAEKYGGDSACASGIILISTLFSLVTIPLFCRALEFLS